MTLLLNLHSGDEPTDLLSALLYLAKYVDTHIVVVLTIQGHLTEERRKSIFFARGRIPTTYVAHG